MLNAIHKLFKSNYRKIQNKTFLFTCNNYIYKFFLTILMNSMLSVQLDSVGYSRFVFKTMFFYPVFRDNKPVPLSWQIKAFFFTMTWPLKENPSFLTYLFRYSLLIVEFSSFLFIILGCIRFIYENTNDIVPSVEALLSCIALSDCCLRISNAAFNTASLKDFIVYFYKNIYVTENENSDICKQIKRSLVPTTIYTYSYILTLMCFCVMPIINPILGNEAELPCRIIVDYDIENPIYYNITMLLICCISVWVFFFFSGEAFLWAICIVHLNARYEMLQFKFKKRNSSLMKTVPPSELAFELRKNINNYFDKICGLNRFSKQFVKIYNFRLFVMISFSALTLCVVSFQIVESTIGSQFLAYLFWLIAKITELLIFGNLGGAIINTTNQISSMYYHSNWENIIYRSTDLKENILLLKHVHIAIALHRIPIQMTGSTFFVVSLSTVEKILRLSGSYFAFLYTIKRITMN